MIENKIYYFWLGCAGTFIIKIVANIAVWLTKSHLNNIIFTMIYCVADIIKTFPSDEKDILIMHYGLDWLVDGLGIIGIFYLIHYHFFSFQHRRI